MTQPTHSHSNGPEIELATESTAIEAAEPSHSRVHNRTSGRILNIASYLILAIGIATMAATAYLMLAAYTTVPYWDEWGMINEYIGSNSHLHLQWIWAQCNEHRVVPYKLLFLLDLHFLRGREWPMFVGIFLSQLSLFGLLAFLSRKVGNLEGWVYRCAVGIAAYCLFCPSQWENFYWGFQLSFVLVNLLFTSALAALLLLAQAAAGPRSRQRMLLAVSVFAAAAATVCNANGVLAWPILIAASLLLRLRRSITVTYVLSGAALAGLYFHGYVSPTQHASPVASFHLPLQIVEYIEKYFGSSFVPSTHLDWSLQLGAIGLTVVFGLSLWIVWHLDSNDRLFSVGLLSLMGYMFLTACVTALGRLNFGTNQAFSSRYQSYALLFWLAFAILVMTFLIRRKETAVLAVLSLGIVALLGVSIPWYRPILRLVKDTAFQRELAGSAVLTGVRDDDLVKGTIWIYPPAVWDVAAYFKQHGLSMFSTEKARSLNQPLTAVYKVGSSEECSGFIEHVQSFEKTSGGLKLEGWAVNRPSIRPLHGIVMVNEGLISGIGVAGYRRSDIARNLHSRNARFSGWLGFVEPGAKGNTTEVYGIMNRLGRGKVCKIGQVMSPGT